MSQKLWKIKFRNSRKIFFFRKILSFNYLQDRKISEFKKQIAKKQKEKEELLLQQAKIISEIDRIKFKKSSVESSETFEKSSTKDSNSDDENEVETQSQRTQEEKSSLEPYRVTSSKAKVIPLCYNHCFYIANVHPTISKEDLQSYFTNMGIVQRIFLTTIDKSKDREANIYFQAFFDVIPEKTFDFVIDGHQMKAVDKSTLPIPEMTKSMMVSGNISSLSKLNLCNFFCKYGKIVNFSDASRTSRNRWKFVFIKFSESKSVDEAVGKKNL